MFILNEARFHGSHDFGIASTTSRPPQNLLLRPQPAKHCVGKREGHVQLEETYQILALIRGIRFVSALLASVI